MSSTNETALQRLYRAATRGLPAEPAQQLSADELLCLARNEPLAARQHQAVLGLAASSSQSAVLHLLAATAPWSRALAGEIRLARRPGMLERLQIWWQEAGALPLAAAAGMAFAALLGLRLVGVQPGVADRPPPALPAVASESALFRGEFEPSDLMFAASLENRESDQLFGGNFDG